MNARCLTHGDMLCIRFDASAWLPNTNESVSLRSLTTEEQLLAIFVSYEKRVRHEYERDYCIVFISGRLLTVQALDVGYVT